MFCSIHILPIPLCKLVFLDLISIKSFYMDIQMLCKMAVVIKMAPNFKKGFTSNCRVKLSVQKLLLVQNLSEILQKDKKHPFLKDSVEQLYENSLLIEGLLDNPSQVLSRFQKFMESASAYELEKIS